MERLLTVEDVAQYLGVDNRWVWTYIDRLPAIRIGKQFRFRRAEIEAWLDACKVANANDPDAYLARNGMPSMAEILDGMPNAEEIEELLSHAIAVTQKEEEENAQKEK